MDSHSLFMKLAMDKAWQFQTLTRPNPAVGALILHNNQIIALQAHQKAGAPHAEVLACKQALLHFYHHDKGAKKRIEDSIAKNLEVLLPQGGTDPIKSVLENLKSLDDAAALHKYISLLHSGLFEEAYFYVTLEPCNHYGKTPPCAALLALVAPKKVIVASKDLSPTAKGGMDRLKHAGIEVIEGVLQNEGEALLLPFHKWQKNEGLVLFKVAHRLDGSYGDGVISNLDSRIYSHNMRTLADSIVISGQTLRNDNPRLDTRFSIKPYSPARLPKVVVLSRKLKARDLHSFRLASRDVSFVDSPHKLPRDGFVIIEGGFGLLSRLLDSGIYPDLILGYVAPSLGRVGALDCDLPLQKGGYSLASVGVLKDFWQGLGGEVLDSTANVIYWFARALHV